MKQFDDRFSAQKSNDLLNVFFLENFLLFFPTEGSHSVFNKKEKFTLLQNSILLLSILKFQPNQLKDIKNKLPACNYHR